MPRPLTPLTLHRSGSATAPSSVTAPPLHLAFVTETYPPEINGVALTVARSIEFLRSRGHRVELVRPRQESDRAAGSDERLTPGVGLPFYPGVQFGLPVIPRLRRCWRLAQPRLVHIATEGPLGWAALQAASALGIPVTTDYRTQFHRYSAHYGAGFLEGVIDRYLRAFHNRAALTFVSTDALRRELGARGYRNLATVGRGIDTALFSPSRRDPALRAAWGCAPGDLAVLHVGRLAPEKNLELAVQAFEALRSEHPRARMIWVGDGPARRRLERRHPHHRYTGFLGGTELARHYASADIFLFPSTTETFGNVTLEALASGLALVAYGYGAAAQHAQDGVTARLAPPGDAHAFVRAAQQVGADALLRARLRSAAPLAAARCDWPTVLAGFEAHLAAHALPRPADRRHA